jgi:multidrug resistance efflux pump
MAENVDLASTSISSRRHSVILRSSALVVGTILSILMMTAVMPPLVADQSDRAMVDAPITLLTAPIEGEIKTLSVPLDSSLRTDNLLARISNTRVDRGTLISLEDKVVDTREKLQSTQAKAVADRQYLASLDAEIADQTGQVTSQLRSQIVELRARVAESDALSAEKRALVDRQTNMVDRNAASMDMLRPTTQQYSATLHKADAARAKLDQKIGQLDALQQGIYIGDDLVTAATLAQKRRDIDLDAKRMEIEEKELSAVLRDKQQLIETERKRLAEMAAADIRIPTAGKILNVSATPGRLVKAGDSIASLIDCEKRFVVAIFSYRQGQSMAVGTRVRVEGTSFRAGVVTEIIPKTSDRTDERFAVPFPQTERRELYAIIAPEDADRSTDVQKAMDHDHPASCTVGEWVTVTKDKGYVPSMSVTWRRLETLVSSWSNPASDHSAGADQKRYEAGIAFLGAALRSGKTPPQEIDAWSPRTDTMVSR